jgi:pyruvate formate lyase activating enzyme
VIIGGLQKSTLIDYPGKVAAIVFTRGCALRCHYCHNPELVLPERFVGPISEQHVFDFLATRKGKLDGVVVSGGEPAMQKDLPTFLGKIKAMGFLVKLDTSGLFPDMLQTVIKGGVVDYVAMDIKAPFSKYSEVVGVAVDTKMIERSIGIIKSSGVDYEFRTTVVKQQLSKQDITEIAKLAAGSSRYIIQKFRQSDTVDPKFSLMGCYSPEELVQIASGTKQYIKNVEVR